MITKVFMLKYQDITTNFNQSLTTIVEHSVETVQGLLINQRGFHGWHFSEPFIKNLQRVSWSKRTFISVSKQTYYSLVKNIYQRFYNFLTMVKVREKVALKCNVCDILSMCVVLAPLSCEQLYMKANTHTHTSSATHPPLLRSIQTRKEMENCVIFSKPRDICLSMSCLC